MAAWKLAPALCTGCTFSEAGRTNAADRVAAGRVDSGGGFPEGVVNIVPGYGETAAPRSLRIQTLIKSHLPAPPRSAKLILQAAAGNLKKVSLELAASLPTWFSRTPISTP